MISTLQKWDRELLVYLNNLGSENFDGFWLVITKIGTWFPLFFLFILLIFRFYKTTKNRLLVFLVVLITCGAAYGSSWLTKLLIERPRPYGTDDLAPLLRILVEPKDFSFFSGHAATSFAVTTFLVLVMRKYSKWVYLLYLWPIFFVYSRIYVGAHFPSDIAVGALVGTSFAYLGYLFAKKRLPVYI